LIPTSIKASVDVGRLTTLDAERDEGTKYEGSTEESLPGRGDAEKGPVSDHGEGNSERQANGDK